MRPMAIFKAAGIYWALIFAAGFVLGTLRVLWGADAMGAGNFMLLEIPLLLIASWFAARWLVARYSVRTTQEAVAMGAIAFVLLMGAEIRLAAGISGEGVGAWLASLTHPPGIYGFLGQIAFALMPWLVVRMQR